VIIKREAQFMLTKVPFNRETFIFFGGGGKGQTDESWVAQSCSLF
jgi:hypothetical protein